MNGIGADSERVSPQQQLTVDYMQMAGHRSIVHGLVELDITDARERIQTIKKETGTKLSFTAFIVSCLATTVEEQPHVQRYRDWQGRIHEFEGVDVNVLIEQETDGEQIGIPHVIRQANQRTVRSIHDEIRRGKADTTNRPKPEFARLARRLPGFLSRQIWRSPSGSRHGGSTSPAALRSPLSACSALEMDGPSVPRTTPFNSPSAASAPNHA